MEQLDYIASVLDELAMLRKVQGRTDEARECWNQSLEMFTQLQSVKMIAEVTDQLNRLTEG